MSDWPITYREILDARERLRPVLSPTPLRSYPPLDAALGLHLLVKHENHQPTNSFKARNALSVLTLLPEHARRRGIVAATRGNHGGGLAWAGHLLGVPVTVVVPEGNNPEKNEAMTGWGAELVVAGRDYDESLQTMQALEEERGLTPVHSTNEPLVLAGAGTLALEMVEQLEQMGEQLDLLVVAVGGGSQAVGSMTVLRERLPDVAVIGVQAERARATHDSWHAGEPLTRDSADTFADGLATRSTYALTFPALRSGLTDFILATEEEIAAAIRLLLRTTHNLAEGAGAAGLAGLTRVAERFQGKTAAVILSGGNIDQQTLRWVLA